MREISTSKEQIKKSIIIKFVLGDSWDEYDDIPEWAAIDLMDNIGESLKVFESYEVLEYEGFYNQKRT